MTNNANITPKLLELLARHDQHITTKFACHSLNCSKQVLQDNLDQLTPSPITIDLTPTTITRTDKTPLLTPTSWDIDKNSTTIFTAWSIPSTHQYLTNFTDISTSNFLCISEVQTHGHGRNNATWHSPPAAGIYLSYAIPKPQYPLFHLAFITGIIIAELCKKITNHPINLKWPNDLYHNNLKLGGILIADHTNDHTIISIGLNTSPLNRSGTTDLATISNNQNLDRNNLVSDICNQINLITGNYTANQFPQYLKTWQQNDILIQKKITIIHNNRKISGIYQGISTTGKLILATNNSTIELESGSIINWE